MTYIFVCPLCEKLLEQDIQPKICGKCNSYTCMKCDKITDRCRVCFASYVANNAREKLTVAEYEILKRDILSSLKYLEL